MNEVERDTIDGDATGGDDGPVRVRCTTDSVHQGLDVTWTKGAIFEFESFEAAERWVAAESAAVPGTFYLADVPPDEAELSVAYYVKYNAPTGDAEPRNG